jgi:uncharacterized Fe-S cluster-containing MiaB family protein
VAEAIRAHDLTQDLVGLQILDCPCKATWRELMDLEEDSFGAPLF